jgi:L-alanine-DL-glutamate epimerase-like enolase superfamily enzyme
VTEAPVAAVLASAYTVPTDAPEADGTFAWDRTTMVLVEAIAGGATGIGWTYAPRAAAVVVDELLAPAVVGRDAFDVPGAWTAMVRAVRNAGRPGVVGMALSAVDIALWDLVGRLHDQPLPALWSDTWDEAAASVEVYGSGGFTTYDDTRLVEQLTFWQDVGVPNVKIKIAESWGSAVERDLARTALAREVVGAGVGVFVDANGGYDRDQACTVGKQLDDLQVAWFEEPVSSDDIDGLARVRQCVAADVAAGEYGWDLPGLIRLAPVVDCLQVDVTRCGGYTEWHRLATWCADSGIELSGHCAPYASLPVAAMTLGLRHLEWFHDHVRIEQRFFEGASVPSGGRLPVPADPGHGLTFRSHDAEEFRVA